MSLNDYSNKNKYYKRREFPWDIYAEKQGKWMIEVTTDVKEDLKRKIPFLWRSLGARMAILFINPALEKSIFKEITELNKTQVFLCLKDLGERQRWKNQYGEGLRPTRRLNIVQDSSC